MSVLTIGIYGSQSSGMTTLAALLSRIIPINKLLIIHGDDFCRELDELPLRDGVLAADSEDNVHFDRMQNCLDRTIASGELSDD